MDALADLLLFVICLHPKDQAAAIDLDQFSGGAYLLAQRSGSQVPDVHQGAHRDKALVQMVGDGMPGGVFHKRDHHRRREDLDSSRSHRGGGIFMDDDGCSLSSNSYSNSHHVFSCIAMRYSFVYYPYAAGFVRTSFLQTCTRQSILMLSCKCLSVVGMDTMSTRKR